MGMRPADIGCIPVSTSLPVGPTNAYVLLGSEPVLVDPGVKTARARQDLTAGLAAHGVRIEDVKHVLITHGHLDHFGLAREVRDRSGADVLGHRADARFCASYPASVRKASARYRDYSARHGFPLELYRQVEGAYARTLDMADGVEMDRLLEDGETVALGGRAWTVLHTPGHTPGSICLLSPEAGVLLSGDTVLRDITPNPFFGGHSPGSPMGLAAYLKVMDRLAGLGRIRVLPGHGPEVPDLAEVIAKVKVHHAAREARILEELARGPVTLFDVSRAIFPELPLTEVWLAFAEILGHVEVLEAAGRVVRSGDETAVRYAAAR